MYRVQDNKHETTATTYHHITFTTPSPSCAHHYPPPHTSLSQRRHAHVHPTTPSTTPHYCPTPSLPRARSPHTGRGRRGSEHSDEVGPSSGHDDKLVVECIHLAVRVIGEHSSRLPHRRCEEELLNQHIVPCEWNIVVRLERKCISSSWK